MKRSYETFTKFFSIFKLKGGGVKSETSLHLEENFHGAVVVVFDKNKNKCFSLKKAFLNFRFGRKTKM